MSAPPPIPAARRGRRRMLAALALVVVLGLAWWLEQQGLARPDAFLALVDHHPVRAIALFFAVYVIATAGLLPTLPLNLAAGFLWGGFGGGTLSAFGASGGALIAFVMARSMFGRPLATDAEGRILAWIRREVALGWKMVAFLRLNPIFPTGPLNYLLGLTGLPFRTYAWSTLVFLWPPSLCVALAGDQLKLVTLDGSLARIWPAILLISAAIVGLVVLKRAATHFYPGEKLP